MKRMYLRIALVAAGAAVVAAGTPCLRAQAVIPGVEWDELTQAVHAVAAARRAEEASAAYARGCTANRQSVKLQDTYMRKCLTLGRPDLANVPARELTNLDAKNGIAWGVIAYVQAQRGLYAAALPCAVRAAELEPDNASIVQNAAQLVAWYEGGKRPPIDAATQQSMNGLQSGKAFAGAYKKAKDGFAKLDKEKEAKKKEAAAADAEAKRIEVKYKQVSDQLKMKGQTYERSLQSIEDAKRQLARARDNLIRASDYNARRSYERQCEDMDQRIRRLEQTSRDYLNDGRQLRKEKDDLEKEAKAKRDAAFRLLREANSIEDGVPTSFSWYPPAVEGVVTPDATLAPLQPKTGDVPTPPSYLAPDKPDLKVEPLAPPLTQRLAEAEAADKLSLAKICLGSKEETMRQTGRNLLEEVVTKYPNTPAAAEAQALLRGSDPAAKPE